MTETDTMSRSQVDAEIDRAQQSLNKVNEASRLVNLDFILSAEELKERVLSGKMSVADENRLPDQLSYSNIRYNFIVAFFIASAFWLTAFTISVFSLLGAVWGSVSLAGWIVALLWNVFTRWHVLTRFWLQKVRGDMLDAECAKIAEKNRNNAKFYRGLVKNADGNMAHAQNILDTIADEYTRLNPRYKLSIYTCPGHTRIAPISVELPMSKVYKLNWRLAGSNIN